MQFESFCYQRRDAEDAVFAEDITRLCLGIILFLKTAMIKFAGLPRKTGRGEVEENPQKNIFFRIF
jgi:hypothetical protein